MRKSMFAMDTIDVVYMPVWATDYLVNGDASSLCDDEIYMIDEWAKGQIEGYDYIVYELHAAMEEEFTTGAAFGLAATCILCKLHGGKYNG